MRLVLPKSLVTVKIETIFTSFCVINQKLTVWLTITTCLVIISIISAGLILTRSVTKSLSYSTSYLGNMFSIIARGLILTPSVSKSPSYSTYYLGNMFSYTTVRLRQYLRNICSKDARLLIFI